MMTMYKIKEKYDEQVSQLNGRCDALNVRKEKITQEIQELESRYSAMVMDGVEEVSEVVQELNGLNEQLQIVEKQIGIIEENTASQVKKMANIAVKDIAKREAKLNKTDTKLVNEIDKTRDKLIGLMVKLQINFEDNHREMKEVGDIIDKADDELVYNEGLESYSNERGFYRKEAGNAFYNYLIGVGDVYSAKSQVKG